MTINNTQIIPQHYGDSAYDAVENQLALWYRETEELEKTYKDEKNSCIRLNTAVICSLALAILIPLFALEEYLDVERNIPIVQQLDKPNFFNAVFLCKLISNNKTIENCNEVERILDRHNNSNRSGLQELLPTLGVGVIVSAMITAIFVFCLYNNKKMIPSILNKRQILVEHKDRIKDLLLGQEYAKLEIAKRTDLGKKLSSADWKKITEFTYLLEAQPSIV